MTLNQGLSKKNIGILIFQKIKNLILKKKKQNKKPIRSTNWKNKNQVEIWDNS